MSMFMPVGGKPFEKIICGASAYMGTLRRLALLGGGGGAGVRSHSAIPPYIDILPEKRVCTPLYIGINICAWPIGSGSSFYCPIV